MMKVTYDKEADAVFIYLMDIHPGEVKFTDSTDSGPLLHYNQKHQLIGVEILNASKNLPAELLVQATDITLNQKEFNNSE